MGLCIHLKSEFDLINRLQSTYIKESGHITKFITGNLVGVEENQVFVVCQRNVDHIAQVIVDEVVVEFLHLGRIICLLNGGNTTIYEFILACRIDRAKELLADREKKLSEIAALVGYERQSSFSAAFHQKTGITPNEFRRQFWNK